MIGLHMRNVHDNKNKMTLKERLIAQKQERLNQDILTRMEEKRYVPTSIPYNEGAKKQPYDDGNFYKSQMPSSLADSIKRMKNSELDKLKSAHVKATNLGPGVS